MSLTCHIRRWQISATLMISHLILINWFTEKFLLISASTLGIYALRYTFWVRSWHFSWFGLFSRHLNCDDDDPRFGWRWHEGCSLIKLISSFIFTPLVDVASSNRNVLINEVGDHDHLFIMIMMITMITMIMTMITMMITMITMIMMMIMMEM